MNEGNLFGIVYTTIRTVIIMAECSISNWQQLITQWDWECVIYHVKSHLKAKFGVAFISQK